MSLTVYIFDVGRGLCLGIITPNQQLILIDCGTSDSFSPVEWLASEGYKLTKLIITHLHEDHIADIQKVTQKLSPNIIRRRKDIDWNRTINSNTLSHYKNNYCPGRYNQSASDPDWGDGMTLQSYSLDSQQSAVVSNSDSSYINNMSIVTILKYRNYTFAFPGDIESEGMAKLIQTNNEVCNQIKGGIHFLVAAHHGHPSGFSADWFNLTGPTGIFNIVSERSPCTGENANRVYVDTRYSGPNFSQAQNRENRKMVSTREKGHLIITISDDGKWNWDSTK